MHSELGASSFYNPEYSSILFLCNVAAEHLRTIGLLDIFGFESFKVGD
jgi:hypothetical protein